ncbi:MAG: zinc ABC transporter substrate-binding protein [Rhodospirillum sp.]|nr:zinc ABC transporter substrate-binding protein [Rhodospirillum sp.]MCF8487807.1 zinc ABC transporter substrate-binding protein [Rhodospirillum sp.]MCF8499905.1 zinc ABC transporter substrate-binding protein [Rhodospirillum sp.]
MHPSRALPFASLVLPLTMVASMPALAAEGGAPTVVVDIAPLQGLVASVMGDLGEPHLLVPNGASPHDFALRPSDARSLGEADLVVWVGPGLSPFLTKPLETLASKAQSLEMEDLEGVTLLPYRDLDGEEGDHDEDHDHAEDHGAEDTHGDGHHHHAGNIDPHMWLSPDNGLELITAVESALSTLDPAHAATYAANAEATRTRIGALKSWMEGELRPLADKRYMVFHDAYQYVETLGGPKAVGALTLSPEVNPGAKHLSKIRARLSADNVACVFAEPQFPTALVDRVIEGTATRAAVLDPLGAGVPPGPGHYEATLRDLTDTLTSCLSGE